MSESGRELYKKHRPTKFSELVGQPDAVRMLADMGKRNAVPHCLLFTGPSGCGKTTTARILADKLQCSDADFTELNIADVRGIDTAREIRERMGLAPLGGSCRIWLLDEVARATTDAQNAFLKILEDTPEHVYFFLCTTEPQKLLATIKTRATEVKFKLVGERDMEKLLNDVAKKESFDLSKDVRGKIVASADGSPRKALVLLNQVVGLKVESEQLAAISAGVSSTQAIAVARAIFSPGCSWPSVAKLLKEIEDEPETVRRVVLGYAKSVLLGGGSLAGRAAAVIGEFERAWYDGGAASMALSCWNVVNAGKGR